MVAMKMKHRDGLEGQNSVRSMLNNIDLDAKAVLSGIPIITSVEKCAIARVGNRRSTWQLENP